MAALVIGRLALRGVASGGPAAESRAHALIGSVTAPRLAAACHMAFAGVEAGEVPVVVIRRIAVDIDINAGPPHDLSRLIADGLAALVPRLAARPGEHGVCFASRAHWTGAFMAALVRGDAWRHWWFEAFADLAPLPLSAALRTLVMRDPVPGAVALRLLGMADRAAVVAALTADDARILLGGLAAAGGAVSSAEAGRALLLCLAAPPGTGPAPCRALAQALAALAEDATLSPTAAVAAALAIAQLARSRDPAAFVAALRASGAPGLPALVRQAPSEARLALAEHLAGSVRGIRSATELPGVQFSAFAGLAMLVPHVPGAAELPGPLLLLVLAACAGAPRAGTVLDDPAMRLLCDVPARATVAELGDAVAALPAAERAELRAAGLRRRHPADRRWLRLPAAAAPPGVGPLVTGLGRAALAAFAARLPGFSGSSAAFLWERLLSVSGQIETGSEVLRITIERPPLDVLLAISGLADRVLLLPGGRTAMLVRRA